MLGRLFEEIGRCFQLVAGLVVGAALGLRSTFDYLFGFEQFGFGWLRFGFNDRFGLHRCLNLGRCELLRRLAHFRLELDHLFDDQLFDDEQLWFGFNRLFAANRLYLNALFFNALFYRDDFSLDI